MIVPIEVATNGYIGTGLNTLSIASDGYLITVTIERLPLSGGFLVKGTSRTIRRKERDRKWREERDKDHNKKEKKEVEEFIKKITVMVTINNLKYTETKYVDDELDLSVEDVDVQIVETNDKPKITITVIKK